MHSSTESEGQQSHIMLARVPIPALRRGENKTARQR
ncbi:hypothetical protein E2C01_004019 [Portunus trituberculatus]|uniref:Uncharacterized protein n=1 Tax=Portunus trituberculatus TaxID=210409 RepID=A0A5B7CNS2_PORTR|nr:hypothetical protein [Portunus trituberculatus]